MRHAGKGFREKAVDSGTTSDSAEDAPSWLVQRGLVPESGPRRTLAVGSFINMIGNGLFMTGSALFFTRSVGLSVSQVGAGMGAASLIGLAAGIPVGRLADVRGAKGTYLVTLIVQGIAMAAVTLVHSFWLFVAVICVTQLASSAGAASRGPLIRGFGGANPTQFRSYLRAANNLAGACGALAAGVVVQLDTRNAYLTLVLVNALTFLACAAIISRLPHLDPVQAPSMTSRWIALKDKPYLAVTLLDSIMSIHGQVLLFALPLWIVGHSNAPRWLVGASAVTNTLIVVSLQVRTSRKVDSNAAAARAVRRAAVAFLAGMALIAASGGMPRVPAAGLIIVGVVVHTIGELWHAAGSFELSFGLAPAHAQGQYSGLFGMGHGLTNAAAPTILALFCIDWGARGWLAMGAIFIGVGLAMPYVARWAERTRTSELRQRPVSAGQYRSSPSA